MTLQVTILATAGLLVLCVGCSWGERKYIYTWVEIPCVECA